MRHSKLYRAWAERNVVSRYRTGVSLHSHTLHSHECLSFIDRAVRNVPYITRAVERHQREYRAKHEGRGFNLARAWWTPPLSAKRAWLLEKKQIEQGLQLSALVSLTDHDNIEAGTLLSVAEPSAAIPISVEWTLPYQQTFFHIGIHNLPPADAHDWMQRMRDFTAKPAESRILELLAAWGARPDTLVVLNHPMWDEKGIGAGLHWSLVREFLKRFGHFIHALELNGLRPWKENRDVLTLARSASLPVISGGDRHACEPNACINLTNAASFAEFADEVRTDGWSDVLFMPQYREPFKLRIIHNICEVLRENPEHCMGWTRWTDRVFYLCDDGIIRNLSQLWERGTPGVVNQFVGLMGLVRDGWLNTALRFALTEKEEPAL